MLYQQMPHLKQKYESVNFNTHFYFDQVVKEYQSIIGLAHKILVLIASANKEGLYRVANVRHSHVILTILSTHILSQ